MAVTGSTATYLSKLGTKAARVNKVLEGPPHIVDRIHQEHLRTKA